MATTNAKTNWFENKILVDNLSSGKYLALFTSISGETSGGTEVSGGGYARKPISFTITVNQASNSSVIDFGQASASWGTVTHWAIMSAATSGNMYYFGSTENESGVDTGFAVNSGEVIKFPIGSIVITEE